MKLQFQQRVQLHEELIQIVQKQRASNRNSDNLNNPKEVEFLTVFGNYQTSCIGERGKKKRKKKKRKRKHVRSEWQLNKLLSLENSARVNQSRDPIRPASSFFASSPNHSARNRGNVFDNPLRNGNTHPGTLISIR